VKVIAVSSDGLAGVVIHDKYWDQSGYRAVYFSFELEASNDTVANTLFKQAIEWTLKWEYKPVTELLGSVRVPREIGDTFKNTIEKLAGEIVLNQSIVLNEEGASWIEIPAKPGRVHIVIAHPTTDRVSVVGVEGDFSVVATTSINRVTTITLEVRAEASIRIGLRASSDASLNPAYIQVKQERAAETTTTTSPPLTSPTTTPLASPTQTTQTTVYWTPSPTSTPLATTPLLTTRESPLQTTIPPSGVNTYLILGAVIVIIALLIAFLATRRKR
jgi:hypothetical protein